MNFKVSLIIFIVMTVLAIAVNVFAKVLEIKMEKKKKQVIDEEKLKNKENENN